MLILSVVILLIYLFVSMIVRNVSHGYSVVKCLCCQSRVTENTLSEIKANSLKIIINCVEMTVTHGKRNKTLETH